ncbi:MAG: hydantoinase/carbamoylase family amidase [Proteobacteria bacterium]|nr:hydantoinase/carbamoylase family amidase [Pseudomonadota bacterium]
MNASKLEPDIPLAERLLERLREATFDGVGITRASYGEGEQFAHGLVAGAGRDLGLEVETDFAGNLFLTLAGRERDGRRLLVGSHLDSVPQGGNFDGAAGVLAGLAAVSAMARAGLRPRHDLAVVAVRAEESCWFPASYIGSRAALGTLPASVPDEVRRADTGRTLAAHMAELGFDPEAVKRGARSLTPANTRGYIELHIEQGPVLETDGLPVGIVTGIRGSTRRRTARLVGEYGHSGAVPRAYRRDAAAAFAEFAYRLEERWIELEEKGEDLVVTFCTVATDPGRAAFTKIAGEVAFSLDMRSISPETLARMDRAVAELVPEVARRRGVRFDLGPHSASKPAAMDKGLQDGLAAAAEAAGIPCRRMASGAGHDAAAFADAGVPAVMLFVRNQHGSHNPREAMRIEDFAQACRALLGYLAAAA